ncbi:MAG: hypothetical protein RM338_20945 [Nostoc sp. DedQUE12a]|nr:hypothetical protein [Nostoc sp. DedQUE12a]
MNATRYEQIEQVVCVPENGGTAIMERCQNLLLPVDNFYSISRYTLEHGVTLASIY